MLDRDGNGFISKQELGMAMRSLGYMPSEVELAIIMQRLDMDGESHSVHISHIYSTQTRAVARVTEGPMFESSERQEWDLLLAHTHN